MSNEGVDVEIDPQLLQILNNGFDDSLTNVLKDTIMETVKVMRAEAPVRTGNLRRSLEPEYDKSEARIRTMGSSPAYYWIYLQYGTSRMEANPFVTRTIETIINNQVIERAVTKELKSKGLI